VWGNIWIKSG